MNILVDYYDKITIDISKDIAKTGDRKLIKHWNDGWQRQIDNIFKKDDYETRRTNI